MKSLIRYRCQASDTADTDNARRSTQHKVPARLSNHSVLLGAVVGLTWVMSDASHANDLDTSTQVQMTNEETEKPDLGEASYNTENCLPVNDSEDKSDAQSEGVEAKDLDECKPIIK